MTTARSPLSADIPRASSSCSSSENTDPWTVASVSLPNHGWAESTGSCPICRTPATNEATDDTGTMTESPSTKSVMAPTDPSKPADILCQEPDAIGMLTWKPSHERSTSTPSHVTVMSMSFRTHFVSTCSEEVLNPYAHMPNVISPTAIPTAASVEIRWFLPFRRRAGPLVPDPPGVGGPSVRSVHTGSTVVYETVA